nr:hypothetical protein [Tanacetum cinerariifolium]
DFPSFKTTIESLQVAVTAQNDHLAKWVVSSASMARSVGPRMTMIENTHANIQSDIASLKTDTSAIKAMMTGIFCASKGYPTKETSSRTKGEKDDMITKETMSKTADVEKEHVQELQDTEPIPITIVRPTVTSTETKIFGSSSRPQLIDPIFEVHVPQHESQHTTSKPDRGKDNIWKSLRRLYNSKRKGMSNIDGLPPADVSLKQSLIFSSIQTQNLLQSQSTVAMIEGTLRLKVIPREIGINPSLPAPGQVLSISLGRKKEGARAFQRISDIHKVDVDTLLSYLAMATNINTPENQRFCAVMRSMVESHPDKEKLKLKIVKLEAIGHSLN